MKHLKIVEMRKKVVIAAFFLLLFMPGTLFVISRLTGLPFDVELGGYTDAVEESQRSVSAWLSGQLQNSLAGKVETRIKPRGLMVKTYNTINFFLFNKGNDVIGKNRDLFGSSYIEAELALNRANDYSIKKNAKKMKEYVQQLQKLNEKLKEHGKTLVFYAAPSKANLYRENIPDKYFGISQNHARAVDVLRQELSKTDIPYLICADLKDEIAYPTFYTTGIHWSRPYEQYASRKVIELIKEASGTNYRNIVLGEIEESNEPFYRDWDMLKTFNVFYAPDIVFYQYHTSLEKNENAPKMKLLLQGDSFALGLWKDLTENDPDAEVVMVTRNLTIEQDGKKTIELNRDWSTVDWREYLDNADVIVIESTEQSLKRYSYGFPEMLLNVLDDNPGNS